MKTIFAKPNPAFKRAQLLPMNHNILPPTAGGPARRFSDRTPPPTDLRVRMTDPVVCASSVSPRLNLPAVRLLN